MSKPPVCRESTLCGTPIPNSKANATMHAPPYLIVTTMRLVSQYDEDCSDANVIMISLTTFTFDEVTRQRKIYQLNLD